MSSIRPSVALLPLYLEVYDNALPDLLPNQQPFLERVAAMLTKQGADVTILPICRTRTQATEAVAQAENAGVAGIMTLHLAYSPSLESAPPLIATSLPLLVLDTAPKASFGIDATYKDMLGNHGIHGVQDLTSFLRRHSRAYSLAVGPIDSQSLTAKTRSWLSAVSAKSMLQKLKVAQVGGSFEGMGDFYVTPEFLRSAVGSTVVQLDIARLGSLCGEVTDEELANERAIDEAAYDCTTCSPETLDCANRNGIALRKAMSEIGAKALAFNFLVFDRKYGISTVPFLEASKAMSRGFGYAGEGDVLTACLVAALNQCYGQTTFTEMFCADWEGGTVFMAHMGECNPALAKEKPQVVAMSYPYGSVDSPALMVFPLKPYRAALTNLAPGPNESLTLITADVEIVDTDLSPEMAAMPHFWIKPPKGDTTAFLEQYSLAGGTHHLALTPGLSAADLRTLAEIMDWHFVLID